MAILLLKLSVSTTGTVEFVAFVELLQCLKVLMAMQKTVRKGEYKELSAATVKICSTTLLNCSD